MDIATAGLIVAGVSATGLGGVLVAIISGRFGRLTARDTTEEKRNERLSAETREMLAGYRADIAALRAELTNAETRADQKAAAQDAKIERLEALVDTQRETIRKHEDTVAVQNRTIDILRQRVQELEGKTGPAQQVQVRVTVGEQEGEP